ncbi:MAG: hypothetical protein IT175_07985 [Acidobacteria bacterium]|nr:hypothetical protein [Acidobacteriota bacterium]
MTDWALRHRHLELARQELGSLMDSMDSMGDLGRFLPDLRRVADRMDSEIDRLSAQLDECRHRAAVTPTDP